jgi:hypothetical protein
MKFYEISLHLKYTSTAEQRQGVHSFKCGNTVADVNDVLL